MDVLSGLPSLKIAVAYDLDGEEIRHLPYSCELLERSVPVYKEFKGWEEDITQIKTRGRLPGAAVDYIEFIENDLGIPVSIISVGPEETQTIWEPETGD